MLDDFVKTQITTSQNITINLKHGGNGPPLLLLHGYPQTHVMWHKIAPQLAKNFTLVIPDLRGYGDSSKPASDPEHFTYSKRAMAQDQVEVMAQLGYQQFMVAGHDRGARVAYRMALDFPKHVTKLALLDVLPTSIVFETTNMEVAKSFYHWFFLIQPDGLPEKMIGTNAEYYIKEKLKRWTKDGLTTFAPEALQEYLRCSCTPTAIHAACEDYRAGASIDLIHEQQDRDNNKKIQCPVFLLWAKNSLAGKNYDVLKVWRDWATHVEGAAIDCGHFIAEEAPTETYQKLYQWFKIDSEMIK